VIASAAVARGQTLVKRLPDHASIFSAEALAINLALDIIGNSSHKKFLVLSDSLSCLQNIRNKDFKNPLILHILDRLHSLISAGYKISLIWLPSHTGLFAGNLVADAAAKAALNLPVSINVKVPQSDFKPLIYSFTAKRWQRSWDSNSASKLHAIVPTVGLRTVFHLPRREEIIIHRLRIGHTHLTHKHLLHGENPPTCATCGTPLTVEHLLLQCSQFKLQRQKYFQVATMAELFKSVSPPNLMEFLKECDLYFKI
jgi:ribonuclease HI